jgi:serine O-acetyltransferase
MAARLFANTFIYFTESLNMLTLVRSNRDHLMNYVVRQLSQFFPDGTEEHFLVAQISRDLDEALGRLHVCINAVRMWRENEFDYLHSSQYTIFLYFLANTIWRNGGDKVLCTKLFYLNKALNGIDLFYEIDMPSVFFIGHSVGIVLAKATYSDYLVLYQNSTVGKNHGVAPVLEEGVVMYPNTAVIGRCHVATGSVIGQGVSVVNQDTPGNCLVFQGQGGKLVFRNNERPILADIFRL